MNKYILIGSVSGIGGWQLYTQARYKYLKNDYDVYVISSSIDPIQLTGFDNEKILCIPEIFRPIYIYNRKQTDYILNQFAAGIDLKKNDDIFIEASTISTTMWGELLAKTYEGICYSYILHSHIDYLSKEEKEFFKYITRRL